MNVEDERLSVTASNEKKGNHVPGGWRNEPQRKLLLGAFLWTGGGCLLWALLIVVDIALHAQDRSIQDCTIDDDEHATSSLLPAMFGCTIAHQTLLLILVIAGSIDLVTAARRLVKPDNTSGFEMEGLFGALVVYALAELIVSMLEIIFFLLSSDKRSCFTHGSFTWYFIWALPGLVVVALVCLAIVLGVIALTCGALWTLVEHCRAAYLEAKAYNSIEMP